ncbi:MAG: GtrA family protein, partial [Alphaproteobacteria bacterium]|nr:GtrA family protein [Alphaproteobacteria bacterium]
GDVTLAANAVLHNFTLIGAFFLDGMANAAEQLCGRAYGARDRSAFSRAVKLIVGWSLVFGLATSIVNYLVYCAMLFALPGLPPLAALAIASIVAMTLSFLGYSRLVFDR